MRAIEQVLGGVAGGLADQTLTGIDLENCGYHVKWCVVRAQSALENDLLPDAVRHEAGRLYERAEALLGLIEGRLVTGHGYPTGGDLWEA